MVADPIPTGDANFPATQKPLLPGRRRSWLGAEGAGRGCLGGRWGVQTGRSNKNYQPD